MIQNQQEKPCIPVYVDFNPLVEWQNEKEWDTLLFHLQGFTKDQLKVQISLASSLRISASRKLEEDNKWIRFQEEIPVNNHIHDIHKTTARFDNGMLKIKLVKLQPAQEQKPTAVKKPSATTQQKPVSEMPHRNEQSPAAPAEVRKPCPEEKNPSEKQLAATPVKTSELPAETRKPCPEEKKPPEKQLAATPVKTSELPAKTRKPCPEEKNPPGKQLLPATPKTPETTLDAARAATKVSETECPPRGEVVGDRTPAKPPELTATGKEACKSAEMKCYGVATPIGVCSSTATKCDRGKFQEFVCGLSREMKKPRAIINLLLVIVSMAVLWLYAWNALRLTGIHKN